MAAAVVALALPAALQAGSSASATPTVTFPQVGAREVTLEACNGTRCATVKRTVQVLDPTPRFTTTPSASPAVSEVGQLVHLGGAGAGKPPLSFVWEVRSGAQVVATLAGADAYWDTTGFAPGAYTATLRLSNVVGGAPASVVALPAPFVLAPALATSFYTIAPCRVLDTRSGPPLVDGARRDVLLGVCNVPAGARAVAANVTILSHGSGGHVALFPGNYPEPATSVVNFGAGQIRANSTVLALATDGSTTLAAVARLAGSGDVDLIVDVTGYFAPTPLP